MKKFRLKEGHRTVILLTLLVVAIVFIVWMDRQYTTNFVESF